MTRSLSLWLVTGALLASLTWNWRLATSASDGAASCASECGPLDSAALGLTPAQERALDELCAGACRSADQIERRADAREQELMQRLAAGELDEAGARALASEVAALRHESLTACVDGILAVRKVLTPAQVEGLIRQCGPRASCGNEKE